MDKLFGDASTTVNTDGENVLVYQFNPGRLVGSMVYFAVGSVLGLGLSK